VDQIIIVSLEANIDYEVELTAKCKDPSAGQATEGKRGSGEARDPSEALAPGGISKKGFA
jgi:hypothetical protein